MTDSSVLFVCIQMPAGPRWRPGSLPTSAGAGSRSAPPAPHQPEGQPAPRSQPWPRSASTSPPRSTILTAESVENRRGDHHGVRRHLPRPPRQTLRGLGAGRSGRAGNRSRPPYPGQHPAASRNPPGRTASTRSTAMLPRTDSTRSRLTPPPATPTTTDRRRVSAKTSVLFVRGGVSVDPSGSGG